MLKLLSISSVFLSMLIGTANAFDFTNYTPTLDGRYAGGGSPIDSGYSLIFNSVAGPGANVITGYEFIGGVITPVYWEYALDATVGNGTDLGRITTDISGDPITMGYFRNLSAIDNGGAVYNDWAIDGIAADFIGNNVQNAAVEVFQGGAVYNNGSITGIIGDFIGNYIDSTVAQGGAVYSSGDIWGIFGNFINNYANSDTGTTLGGAVYIEGGGIEVFQGDFIGNHAKSAGFAWGGAVYNQGNIRTISGDFIGNYADSATSLAWGGAVLNNGNIESITGDFIGNYANGDSIVRGGAIYNGGNIGLGGNFINNYAISANGIALGGAVYTTTNLVFVADNNTISFSGNYTDDIRGKIYNAVFVETSGGPTRPLTFNTINNGGFIFDDNILGGIMDASLLNVIYPHTYNISLTGDGTGRVIFNNSVINAGSVNVINSTLQLGSVKHDDATGASMDAGGYNHGLFLPAWDTDFNSAYSSPTIISLDRGNLILDYDTPQNLRLAEINLRYNSRIIMGGSDITAGAFNIYGANSIIGDINFNGADLNFFLSGITNNGSVILSVDGVADITDSTINVGFVSGFRPTLKLGATIYLIDAGTLTGALSNGPTTGTVTQGVSLVFDYRLEEENNKLVAVITSIIGKLNPQTKSFAEGNLAGISTINQAANMLVSSGITNAVKSAKGGGKRLGAFTAWMLVKSLNEL